MIFIYKWILLIKVRRLCNHKNWCQILQSHFSTHQTHKKIHQKIILAPKTEKIIRYTLWQICLQTTQKKESNHLRENNTVYIQNLPKWFRISTQDPHRPLISCYTYAWIKNVRSLKYALQLLSGRTIPLIKRTRWD